ncbi:MAG: RecB family exonuclease [Candidatus Woesearchaeota archaeon]
MVLSPSSINLYKQCPRKYYYRYILKLPTADSIHLIRGSVVHTVLETVYDVPTQGIGYEDAMQYLGSWMLKKLKSEWELHKKRLEQLGLSHDQLLFYFEESRVMLRHWLIDYIRKCQQTGLSFSEASALLLPEREKKLVVQQHNIMGIIDVIEKEEGKIKRVVDYKTSAKDKMSAEYELQLAIYALLITETFGYPPQEVVIHFLKFGERSLQVNAELLELAKRECALITQATQSTDIADYPKKPGPLCKWSNAKGSGQCDYYDRCFGQQQLQ